ncbi:YciI family protein [Mucilaginibacter sp. HD30]
MKDYLLVYRTDERTMQALPERTPEEMQANTKRWMDWIGGIAAQNKLADRGNRLIPSGKVVSAGNVIADGPYTEIKECLIGYTIVRAASLDDATELAKDCPVLAIGGNVEVREIGTFRD